jgi:hypothetical protein
VSWQNHAVIIVKLEVKMRQASHYTKKFKEKNAKQLLD